MQNWINWWRRDAETCAYAGLYKVSPLPPSTPAFVYFLGVWLFFIYFVQLGRADCVSDVFISLVSLCFFFFYHAATGVWFTWGPRRAASPDQNVQKEKKKIGILLHGRSLCLRCDIGRETNIVYTWTCPDSEWRCSGLVSPCFLLFFVVVQQRECTMIPCKVGLLALYFHSLNFRKLLDVACVLCWSACASSILRSCVSIFCQFLSSLAIYVCSHTFPLLLYIFLFSCSPPVSSLVLFHGGHTASTSVDQYWPAKNQRIGEKQRET